MIPKSAVAAGILADSGPTGIYGVANRDLDTKGRRKHSAILNLSVKPQASKKNRDRADMNRTQSIALAIAVANLLLITLFPPIDQYSIASSSIPVFAGFFFILSKPPLSEINAPLLAIEIIVVLANLAIAWLLLADKQGNSKSKLGLQNASLLFTGLNLVLMLLFPPMESVFALTKATIPTFEGFFFIFAQKPAHVIVETLLYLEISFILVNGAFLWLIFRERKPPTAEEIRAAMLEINRK
ncbi:MAG: hypothetical protein ACO22Q_00070 [Burkholderiales bacterium]